VTSSNTKLEAALALAAEGYRVLPVTPNDKKPALISKWPIAATNNENQIREWWSQWPDANVARVADEELIADIDPRNGGDATWELLQLAHDIPPTRGVRTAGGGIHFYYRLPEGVKLKQSAANALGQGVDIKSGAGGYVLAPGSVIDGKTYEWLDRRQAVPAPEWMREQVGKARERDPNAGKRVADEDEWTVEKITAFVARQEPESVVEGSRNPTAYTVAARFYDWAAEYATCLEALTDWNIKCCLPPMDQAEVETIARSAETSRDKPVGCKHWTQLSFGFEAVDGIEDDYVDDATGPDDNSAGDPWADKKAGALNLSFFDECETVAPKRWITKDVIAKGETSSWIGPPGGGKSALLTDLSVAVAARKDWRGYRAKERCGVVYFAFERADLVKRRLSVYARRGHKNLPIAVSRGIIDMLNPKCVDVMLATIEEAEKRFDCKVGLIVIDTYSKGIAAGGGDENTARDQNAVAANLQRLHERKTLHIAAVGHTGKDEKRGARGSNAHLADVDTMVQISINGSVKTATVIKGNDQPEGVLTTFKLETVKIGVDEDGDDLTTAVVHAEQIAPAASREKGRRLPPSQMIALRALDAAIEAEGKRPPANATNIPNHVKVIDLDVWRQHAYRLGISASTEERARQVAFKRAAEALFGIQLVGCCGEIVWRE
jgi:hypothetical protein